MDILGHSQIGIAMNTHGHVVAAVQREAACKMEVILSGVAVKVAVNEQKRVVQ